MIFLDHCATTPLSDPARDAMIDVLRQFQGNPSSVHTPGRQARSRLKAARRQVAEALGAGTEDLIFTAGGSEANNQAVKGVILTHAPGPVHLAVSAVEHHCVREAARWLAHRFDWVTLTEILPDASGLVSPDAVAHALRPETRLVSVMHANHETGRIQPIREIARLVHRHGALLHCDAIQSFGRLPVEVRQLDCDLLALSAHKFYGPSGVGALYLRPGIEIDPLIHGGAQEAYRRAGTENLAGAVGMGVAARLAAARLDDYRRHLAHLESAFLKCLHQTNLSFEINGSADDKVPGVLNLAFRGVAQDDLVVGMDVAGFAISAGSACSSGVIEPSHVLQAMGLEAWRLNGGIRISFGWQNTEADAVEAAATLSDLVRRLTHQPAAEELNR